MSGSRARSVTTLPARPSSRRTGPTPAGPALALVQVIEDVLPLEWDLPSGLPAEPPPVRHLRLVTSPSPDATPASAAPVDAGASDPAGRLPDPRPASPGEQGPSAQLPPPAEWTARLARTVIEVVSGERPSAQLRRWTSREVFDDLSRRAACASRHPAVMGRPPQCRRVRSVRVHLVSATVAEACAVILGEFRARAVAIRLEARGDRWIATAVELG